MSNPQQFFDINQLPQEEGILFWGISMSKIGNEQSPENCLKYLKDVAKKINKTQGVGMVTWYGDYLYFHSDEPAKLLRDRYKELMLAHKNGFMNLLLKDNVWIKKAFSFYTFGQVMLDNSEVFKGAFENIVRLYQTDDIFKQCVHDDCLNSNRNIAENEVMFVLEEITTLYLAAKGELDFNNRFVAWA